MQSHGGATAVSDHLSKAKKPKSREVNSRFLSPTSSNSISILSQLNQKPRSSTELKKHKSLDSGFLRGLWPASSVPSPSPSSDSNSKLDTLADCIGNDRVKEIEERKNREKSDRNSNSNSNLNSMILNRQRSCTEFSRFEKEKSNYVSSKENQNHNPILGGSMRYSGGKFKFPRNSPKSDSNEIEILPHRFSIDEKSLRKKKSIPSPIPIPIRRGLSDSDDFSDLYSDTSLDTPAAGKGSPASASYMAPTLSSRKHGIEVPSKFMTDSSSRSGRWSANSKPGSYENSPKNFSPNKGNSNSNWAFLAGRSGSVKGSIGDNNGKMKPPTSPSNKGKKSVGNFLSLGIELLKGKKSRSSGAALSPLGPGPAENVHQLRLLHNRLMQWRYCNARGESVNGNVVKHVEGNFIQVWYALMKLQRSVVQKKLQLQKEKLDMKLNIILQSEIKALETWGNMERHHLSGVTDTTNGLHYVICRIPLIDGATVEPHSASITLTLASDLATSMKSMLTSFSSSIEETEVVFAELAVVVIQEKRLLEECLELFKHIFKLEIQERSLKSSLMQLRLLQQQQQQILA